VKTLCPAILGLEAVCLLLAVLVLRSLGSTGAGGSWALVGLAVLAVVAAGWVRRDPGTAVVLGWGVQVLAVVSGLLVPAMYAVGVIFAGVWWAAVYYGGKVDRLEARRDGPRGGDQDDG
jgi:hypothetical protein